MLQKAQHNRMYRALPPFLRALREETGMSQRDLGKKLGKPQSWVYCCETAIRRVDITEFIAWCDACGVKPQEGFSKLLRRLK